MPPDVVVLDYGSGNLRSAVRAARARRRRGDPDRRLRGRASPPTASSCPASARTPRAWPGCARSRASAIIGRRLAGGRPVLGICVGMQVLFERGVEHGVETEGCDEWPGVVERLQAPVVPAHGLEHRRGARRAPSLFAGHRGRALLLRALLRRARLGRCATNGRTRAPLVTWAEHGGDRFVAAVENGPLTRDPVPPREVRRRRGGAAAQLGRGAPVTSGPLMSKERARRREEREREVAGAAAAPRAPRPSARRAASARRRTAHPLAARGRARAQRHRSRPTAPRSRRIIVGLVVAVNVLVWLATADLGAARPRPAPVRPARARSSAIARHPKVTPR